MLFKEAGDEQLWLKRPLVVGYQFAKRHPATMAELSLQLKLYNEEYAAAAVSEVAFTACSSGILAS